MFIQFCFLLTLLLGWLMTGMFIVGYLRDDKNMEIPDGYDLNLLWPIGIMKINKNTKQ